MAYSKNPRIKTGNPHKDFYAMLCWYAIRDYIYGSYDDHLSAKYFFISEEPEFDGLTSEAIFEIAGLDKQRCYRKAKQRRRSLYKNYKEPARIYVCEETCADGRVCGKEFITLEAYRHHLKTYNHTLKLCARPGCNERAKIKYCSPKCYYEHKRMLRQKTKARRRVERYPV